MPPAVSGAAGTAGAAGEASEIGASSLKTRAAHQPTWMNWAEPEFFQCKSPARIQSSSKKSINEIECSPQRLGIPAAGTLGSQKSVAPGAKEHPRHLCMRLCNCFFKPPHTRLWAFANQSTKGTCAWSYRRRWHASKPGYLNQPMSRGPYIEGLSYIRGNIK